MSKRKNRFPVFLMTVVLALLFFGVAQAAIFTYYGGGFDSTSDAIAITQYFTHDPISVSNTGPLSASSSVLASWPYVTTKGSGTGEANSTENNLEISLEAYAYGNGGLGSAYGNANTNGLLFQLNPSIGEQPGNLVLVSFEWSAVSYPYYVNGQYYAGGSSSISGGSTDTMSLTLNSGIRWSHEKISVTGDTIFNDTNHGSFYAHFGDIIGINLGVESRLDASQVQFRSHTGNNSMTLTSEYVVPLPGAIWFLGSGLIGLVGVGRKKMK
ncbi:MAG: VPLPA-CTERM sorting domain-containing protein [Desulfobacula sp.]|jgi:hypothetical protein